MQIGILEGSGQFLSSSEIAEAVIYGSLHTGDTEYIDTLGYVLIKDCIRDRQSPAVLMSIRAMSKRHLIGTRQCVNVLLLGWIKLNARASSCGRRLT